ncbi:MAG TPA: hypothetical protein VLC09_01650 [Polyangiaceae bacterium]|nr:hypothetical protein [Polyangiaceae bacterium]
MVLPLALVVAAAWGSATACGGSTGSLDGPATGDAQDSDAPSDVGGDDGAQDADGSSATGGSSSGGPVSGPCGTGECTGRCVGTSCDGEWTCETVVGCTDDIHAYCGCDGATFYGSGSCPLRAYAHDGECEAVDCDPSHIVCQTFAEPEPCPEGQVHSVTSGCYGVCVPIAQCSCSAEQACPEPERYVCHGNKARCDYYVQ